MIYVVPADDNFPIVGPFADKADAYGFCQRIESLHWCGADFREDLVPPEDWETVFTAEAEDA